MEKTLFKTSSSEKCLCDKPESSSENDVSTSSDSSIQNKKSKISLNSLGINFRKGRSLQFISKKSKKSNQQPAEALSTSDGATKKSPKWGLRFNCTKSKEPKVAFTSDSTNCCQCMCYRKAEESAPEAESSRFQNEDMEKGQAKASSVSSGDSSSISDSVIEKSCESPDVDYNNSGIYGTSIPGHIIINGPLLDMSWLGSVHEDCDEAARVARAREIEQGVEPPANFKQKVKRVQLVYPPSDIELDKGAQQTTSRTLQLVCPPDLSVDSLRVLLQNHHVTLRSCPQDTVATCHTQVDYIHCLVPDLYQITNCSFYWGKMDRYEAEKLLDGKPEGTFLLRDSAQEDFLFSVSFRKYGRSLHARIEQWNHRFSFDAHDPGVYTSDTVCGLIEHYKDPSSCMFFEPMLTAPLHRNFPFSLQHLCRAAVVGRVTYDDINHLQLPKALKAYLKEYHYRQKVRVARFDDDVQWFDCRATDGRPVPL